MSYPVTDKKRKQELLSLRAQLAHEDKKGK
jgi:hypothetical protein